MPINNWDDDSSTLHDNLMRTLRTVRDQATARKPIQAEDVKDWHTGIMENLKVPKQEYVGRFRGEKGLEDVQVIIEQYSGIEPDKVSTAIYHFNIILKKVLLRLDELIPSKSIPNVNTLDAVLDVCGWVHAEWVRIHPFANGNGRTARLLANYVAMRYGIPPFVRLRPRPYGGAYESVGNQAIQGDWIPTATLFREMLTMLLEENS